MATLFTLVAGSCNLSSLREIRSEGVDWIRLAQDREQLPALVNTVMKFRVPQKGGGKDFLD
jgi:hypothetical protein